MYTKDGENHTLEPIIEFESPNNIGVLSLVLRLEIP